MSADSSKLTWRRDECIAREGDSKKNCPTPRSGYSLSTVGGNVFLFGGLDDSSSPPRPNNDLFILRLKSHEKHEWSRVEFKSSNSCCDVPPPRWRHTASQINDTEFLIFGGYVSSFHRFNDVWVFNAITMCWRQPVPKSSKISDDGNHTVSDWEGSPSPRGDHAAAVIDNFVYIIGGYGGKEYERSHLNDVVALNTNNWKWTSLAMSGNPPPEGRSGHGACVVNGLIYIVGGKNSQTQLEDVYILDPSPKDSSCTWTKVVGCNLPSAISNHGTVAVDRHIFIFGGVQGGGLGSENFFGTYKNDVFVLDTTEEDKPQWYSPPTSSSNDNNNSRERKPEPRSDIDMTYFSKESWIITFGGWANKWYGDVLILDVSCILESKE